MFEKIVSFIKKTYKTPEGIIPLHAPVFWGDEKKYVLDCIESTFVSSIGQYVEKFEQKVAKYTGAKFAVATINGTAALHTALIVAGVNSDHEVITQAVSFVATANAISYCGAEPIFLDSDKDTLGLDPQALQNFLANNTVQHDDGCCYNVATGKKITACVPMHVFGHPVKIDQIKTLCDQYHINLIEDAAESFGSLHMGQHCGTIGMLGILSFNGNKIITTGGGGIILTDDKELALLAKHLTTSAKIDHPWEYVHDLVGYNYRLPNINAALGCAQIELIDDLLQNKRNLAENYQNFFESIGIRFINEPVGSRSNYWLNSIIMDSSEDKIRLLKLTNDSGIMTRPLWRLLPELPMYKHCMKDELKTARWLQERLVNIPSSAIL